MNNYKIKSRLIACFPLFFLSLGCSMAPPEVTPSVPLIKHEGQYSQTYLTTVASSSIDSAMVGETLTIDGNKVIVGREYISALGLKCKLVKIIKQTFSQDGSVCLSDNGWFFAKLLMSESLHKLTNQGVINE